MAGSWTVPAPMPTHAIHAVMLPTGKVLYWDRRGDTYLYDPASQTSARSALPPFDSFCVGHVLLGDGTVFIAGGHIANSVGLNTAAIYNPFTDSWKSLPNMAYGRWYPTCTLMSNGKDVFVESGQISPSAGNALVPELWNASLGAFVPLPNAAMMPQLYPMQYLNAQGNIVSPGPLHYTWQFTPTGSGDAHKVATAIEPVLRSYGSSAMFAPGQILVGGGGTPLNTCEILNLNGVRPTWSQAAPMTYARRQHNFTLLPDGTVLATGGSSGPGFTNPSFPVYATELFNPSSGSWSNLAPSTTANQAICFRGYHSNAVLLPDATVLSTAGDDPATDPSYLSPNYQIFSPPYEFALTKPSITACPSYAPFGSTIQLTVSSSSPIQALSLVRLSAVTHSTNMTQAVAPMTFTQAGATLTATVPKSPTYTPPGYYFVFAIDQNGGVSQAAYLQIGLNSILPAALKITPASGTAPATFSWSDPNSDSSRVQVVTSQDGSTQGQKINTTASKLSIAEPSVNYVQIRALSNYGNSPYSPWLRVTPTTTALRITNPDLATSTDGIASVKSVLTDANGLPVPYAPVQASIAGATVGAAVTDAAGYAEIAFRAPTGWTGGETVSLQFPGTAVYGPSGASTPLAVSARQTSITVVGETATAGENVSMQVSFYGMPEQYPIRNQSFSLTVLLDGSPVAACQTNWQSTANAAFQVPTSASVGSHTVTVQFAGNADYQACSGTGTLTVEMARTGLRAHTHPAALGVTEPISVNLVNARTNQAIPNATVNVQVNGADAGSILTDATGLAWYYMPTSGLTPNPSSVKFTYDGSAVYASTSTTATVTFTAMDATNLTIGSQSVTAGRTATVPAHLRDSNTGLVMPGTLLSVQIGGESPSQMMTDANGQILVTVPTSSPGVVTITVSYEGDALHKPCQISGTVTAK
ncbi:MAG TPA: galactose oxidase-like domain-containing protein [Fimbriimonas sp.]|nr:galactose oxidase-like domain-containing protein [Fimbriimonas sp.]